MVAVHTWRIARPDELSPGADRFSFSCPTPAEERETAASLARGGVLRPLLCIASGERLQVVSGGRRLNWAAASGVAGVPVGVLGGASPAQLWDRLLADAQDHRPLNPVEVGRYLRRRTADTGQTLDELAAEVFPALGLPPRASAAAEVWWVSGLPPEHLAGFADGSRPLHAARLLRRADREDALAVLAAADGLAGGVNKFTELARTLLECAWRDGVPVAAWLDREGLVQSWGGLDGLRRAVWRRRYPELSRWEEAFPAAVAGAGLGPAVSVQPPRGFEGGRYQCRVTFRSLAELRQALDTVRTRLEEGRLDPLGEFLE